MKKITFKTQIKAPAKRVYEAMLGLNDRSSLLNSLRPSDAIWRRQIPHGF